MIEHIQKKLTTIAMYLPLREKQEVTKPAVVPRITGEELLTTTSHNISINGNQYSCTTCLSSFSVIDPGCKHWLSIQCVAPASPVQDHKPTKFNDSVHLGNRTSHSSHDLFKYRGIIYCNTCGARAGTNQIRNLGTQCEPPNEGGRRVLSAIKLGKMPPGITEWPA